MKIPLFTEHTAAQRTPEWFEARLGRVTGSRAAAVWERTKKGERTAAYGNYQDELLAERLSGFSGEDVFVTYEMQRGIDLEPIARRAVARRTGMEVVETGFLARTDVLAGASLDGQIDGFDVIVEIKCPKTTTHLRWLEGATLPEQHLPQVMHNLWVTGARQCLFGSFDDRLPPELQLFVVAVDARDLPLEQYHDRLMEFLGELDEREQAMSKIMQDATRHTSVHYVPLTAATKEKA